MSNPQKTRKVKAWALIDGSGVIATSFNHAHNVFQPRVYSTVGGAVMVAEVIETGAAHLKVVPCLITYSLPSPKPKKK